MESSSSLGERYLILAYWIVYMPNFVCKGGMLCMKTLGSVKEQTGKASTVVIVTRSHSTVCKVGKVYHIKPLVTEPVLESDTEVSR